MNDIPTHWVLNKMANVLEMTLSFLQWKVYILIPFSLKFVLGQQLGIIGSLLGSLLVHYLKQRWPYSPMS